MAKARFYLRAKNKDGLSLIQMKVTFKKSSFESERLNYNTSFFLPPEFWSKSDQRVFDNFKSLEYAWINDELNQLSKIVRDTYRDYLTNKKLNQLSALVFKMEIDTRYRGSGNIHTNVFQDWSREWLESEFPKKADFSKESKMRMLRFLDFMDEAFGKSVLFQEMGLDWHVELIRFFRLKKMTDNYIYKQLEQLRRLIKYALQEDKPIHKDHQLADNKTLKVKRTKGFKIALTPKEIAHLYQFEYEKEKHRRVVDLFCANCYTGFRYSNWKNLNYDHVIKVDDHELLDIQPVKDGPRVVLPIHPIVKEVLVKYDGYPKVISEQKLRDYIKEAAKEAGFDDIVQKRVRKGKTVTTKYQRWELMTTHVARNSFNTNALDAGIPDRDVKKFMGHRNKDMTDVYDRRSPERVAIKYVLDPFFCRV